MEKSFRCFTD